MSESGSLSVGLNVDIQRTDGRIHSAVISSLNNETKTVTVEWYERGESKGKEIDFQTIFKLNSDYAPNKRVVSGEVSHDESNQPPAKSQPVSIATNNNNARNNTQMRNPQPVATANATANAALPKVPSTSRVATLTNPNVPKSSQIPASITPALQSYDEDDRTETTEPLDNYDKKGIKNANRKSNCVKEIERIQQRREERRAAQKAVKDQPDFDPSNPNYDFLMMINNFQDTLDYTPITNSEPIEYHQICVCVRKRPINKREHGRKEIDVITVPNKQNVIVHEPKYKVDLTKYLENQNFRFDYAFDETADNATVYRYTAKPLVECIFEKGMATCFAYGQTGSGKTHTMGGEFQSAGQQNYSGGIYAMAANDVFHLLNSKYRSEDLIVQSAFFEIYGGKVFDLLNKKEKLRILEDAKNQVQIVGLKTSVVSSVGDVLNLLALGNKSRTSGQTSANQHSSRSHAVFQIILKKRQTNRLWGKFSLIDLAGNERGADTSSADRNTRMEGAEINKSLLALKECIRALGRKGAHRPFRASKLTQVLRDSFIGTHSRTCMISMISPGMMSCEHTLNTLRYADRVKELGPGGGGGNGATTNANADETLIYGQGPTAAPSVPISSGKGNSNSSGIQQPHNISASGDNNNNDVRNNYRSNNINNNNIKRDNTNDDYEEYDEEEYDDGNLNETDDLALVRSANADFIDDDMFNFQELVNKIEELEDTVCEKHKELVQDLPSQLKKHTNLFKMTRQVDYPLDEYSNKLEELLDSQLKELTEFKNTVQELRSELKKEEEISNRLLANRNTNNNR